MKEKTLLLESLILKLERQKGILKDHIESLEDNIKTIKVIC